MKFAHGAWLWEKTVTPTTVKRINEYRVEKDSIWISGLDRMGSEGGDRFEGLILQIKITSPMPDVIRVQAYHHLPKDQAPAGFDLDYKLSASGVKIQDTKDQLIFTSGKLTLRITKSPWAMRFEDETGALVTGAGKDMLGHMAVVDHGVFIMQRLSMAVGECIYGMGERFGPLVKNGQTVTIWNEDGGTVSDLAYKNIAFYLSSRGYGLLLNSPGKAEFEVCTERVSQMQFSVPGEALDYYVFLGPSPLEVLEKYTRLSGRPAIPPAWSYGLWLSTSFTTRYDEKTVNEFIDGMFKRGIPLKVFHFDCFWMKERHWCDFEWDKAAFPDPAGMIKRIKAKGMKICVWMNPYISSLSKLFPEGREKGYFIKKSDGSVFQRDAWQPGMALVDFTNPAATKWFCSKLKALLDMGVDCFKTDFGEFIPYENVTYFDGSDPLLMHNYYAYLYNQAVFGLLEEYHGKGNAIVFARSASAGSQKFPIHWGGDCEANFESMAEDLRGGLSFCMSGPAYWSHDIGGFTGFANPSLYKRWVALGLLSTHSRLHGSESYRVPWLFDEESVDVMRHFVKLKNTLFPYLFSASHDAGEFGWPVMRAMVLEFPDDPACRHLDRQFMLGKSLLVAPIFRQDDIAEYYLPDGKWCNVLTGKIVKGGAWQRETLDFMHIPFFIRENSIVPFSSNEQEPQWKLTDEITLHAFAIADGADISLRLVSSDGQSATINAKKKDGKLTLKCDGKLKKVRLLLRGTASIQKPGNGKISETSADGVLIDWNDSAKPLTVETA